MRVTRAVTHIHLCDVNHAKLEALDRLAAEYLRLCQQYTTAFCTEVQPDKYLAPCFASTLSQRWQRVVIQHAAGIAQSWRSNYANASQDYLDLLAAYEEGHEDGERAPVWKEWHTPLLKEAVIQANVNVARLEASEDSGFDYWLCLSTLEKGQPLWLPVKLAAYHRQTLAGKALNTSTTLIRKQNGWWLTLSFDEQVPVDTPKNAPVIGVDVGIANFITTSTGKQYGSFNGKLTERHKRDREKRRRKAKLRACLKKKGVKRLPSTRNKKLARQVRQEINRAVNQLYADYPDAQFAYEQLNVAGMKFKARRMNAYLYASNLAHLPKQLAWGAANGASVPGGSKAPIVPKSAIIVIVCPAPIVPISKRFAVWSAGTPLMPTSTRQRIWRVASTIKSLLPVQTARPSKRSWQDDTRIGKISNGWP